MALVGVGMADEVFALLHEEDGSYGISFPDFPGVISGGDTAEEAIRRGRDTLAFHVASLIDDGDMLPRLRGLAELRDDPVLRADFEGAVVVLVPIELPGKTVRINISIDETLLESVDRAAKGAGESRSGYLAKAAKERLAK
jgi:predicted RNase H-like HicB family nuclease